MTSSRLSELIALHGLVKAIVAAVRPRVLMFWSRDTVSYLLASQSHACTRSSPSYARAHATPNEGKSMRAGIGTSRVARGPIADIRLTQAASLVAVQNAAWPATPCRLPCFSCYRTGPATRLSLIDLHHGFPLGDQGYLRRCTSTMSHVFRAK